MNRIFGIETEYGCLVASDPQHGPDAWPARVKNYLFRKSKAGAIDLHYRDYEEPPGNGGFLLNGGRLYIDMGHLEYSSPECRMVRDIVSYDLAGDALLQSALEGLRATEEVAFIKNNIDHHTGATFGCHENYLMKRDLQFNPQILGTLLSFLATRQLFTRHWRARCPFSSASARITSSTTSTSGCSSTARSSMRATSRWRTTGAIGGCTCSSATRI
jgi:proteasome accessory factor A